MGAQQSGAPRGFWRGKYLNWIGFNFLKPAGGKISAMNRGTLNLTEPRLSGTCLRLDQSAAHRVPHQARRLVNIQFLHQPHSM